MNHQLVCACFLILRGPTVHFQFQYTYISVANPLPSVEAFCVMPLVPRPSQNLCTPFRASVSLSKLQVQLYFHNHPGYALADSTLCGAPPQLGLHKRGNSWRMMEPIAGAFLGI